jgi:pimeloyl-ACP methyl ester carboxylesterase
MSTSMVEYGVGPDGHPYHRFGNGTERLVLVPGVTDPLGWNQPDRLTTLLLSRYYFPAFREYDVWVVSRPPGLSAGQTAAGMADSYADVLDRLGGAHVLGISLGGLIATHLAARHPDVVDQLVLGVSGTHLGAQGRQTLRRWKDFADAGQWNDLHVDYADTVYDTPRGTVFSILYRLGARLLPRPQVDGDVSVSCAAALAYDGEGVLERVAAPTLVVGGTRDELFPEPLQRDAARRVPDGHVATLAGGHAVYDERRRAFNDTVVRFLSDEY